MDDFPKTSTYIIIFPYLQLDLLRGQLVSSMWSKHNEDIPWMSCSKTVDLHTLDKKELLIHRQQKKVTDQNGQLENKQTTYFGCTQYKYKDSCELVSLTEQPNLVATKYFCKNQTIKLQSTKTLKSISNQTQNRSHLNCNLALKEA